MNPWLAWPATVSPSVNFQCWFHWVSILSPIYQLFEFSPMRCSFSAIDLKSFTYFHLASTHWFDIFFKISFPNKMTFPWSLFLPGVSLPIQASFTSAKSILSDLLLIDCWLICRWRRKLSQIVCFFCQLFFCHLFLLTCPGHTPVPAGTPIFTTTQSTASKTVK